jgi:broad-specificity NMP kinase
MDVAGAAMVPALLITGPVGVGKTAASFEVSERLEQLGISHASIDADLTYLYPEPSGDEASVLDHNILQAVWTQLCRVGAERLILTRVVRSRHHLDAIRNALPHVDIRVVRLTAPYTVVEERLRRRELGSGLEWHLKVAEELMRAWEREPVEDWLIDTANRSVREVAEEILKWSQWLERPETR